MIVKRLVLSAFGPFSGQEEIDFTKFNDQVFLIGGDTGAGKTTIFDGICFALYGKPSGSLRKEGTLRNQDAGRKAASYAELTFTAADGNDYTVHRDTPEHRKPGDSAPPVSADSVRLTDSGGVVLMKGAKKVTDMVTRITGFDREAFLRVSVLPQGEFDKFLTADSKTRRDTLRRIFGTQLYESYAQIMQKWLKAADEEMSEVNSAYNLLIERYFPSNGEPRYISGADNFIPELEEMLAESRRLKQEAAGECEEISARLISNNTQKSAAEKANAAVLEWKTALAERNALAEKQADFAAREVALARQKLAAEAAPALERRNELAMKKTSAQKRLTEAEKQAEEASKSLEGAKNSRSAAALLTAERESAIGSLPGLEALLTKCEEARKALAECREIEQNIEEIHSRLTSNAARQEVCSKDKQRLTAGISEAEKTTGEIPGIQAEYDKLTEAAARLKSLGGEISRLNKLRRECERAQSDRDSAETSCNTAERRGKELRVKYYSGEAARLAKELKVGERCPVCGSLEHPFPAVWTEEIPTAEQLDEAEGLASDAAAALAAAEKALAERKGRLEAQHTSVCREYQSAVGGEMPENGADKAVSEQLDVIKGQCAERSAALEKCKAAEESLTGLRDSLASNEKLQASLEQSQAELNGELSRLNSDYAAKKAAAEEKRSGLDGRTPETLAGEIAAKKARIKAIDEQQRQAEAALSRASQNAAAAGSSVSEIRAALAELEKELSAAEADLNAELKRCGFADSSELSSLIVKREEIAALERAVQTYRQAVIEADTRLSECEKRLPEIREIRPLEQFDEIHRALSEELNKCQERMSAHGTEAAGLESTISEISSRVQGSRTLARKQQTLKELNRVINGSGEERISFEAFIQMNMFRGVLEEANQRLDKMSGGRYRFVLRTQNVRANAAEGLDIDIIDYNSGSEARRDVSTLSGGERFLASFALAIGLSDYTLRQGAGRRSDMLFIDEGFSALDSDTFSLAFEVIEKLRSQNRMVGIITHVGEIQEYFRDRRIYVRKGKSGSTISAVCRE